MRCLISIRSDIANYLSDVYPERCIKVLKEISEMNVDTGLPKQFVVLAVSAEMGLKYGVAKDYL